MRFKKSILAIFALFMIILSATAVSAIDDTDDVLAEDDTTNSTDDGEPVEVGEEADDNETFDGEGLDVGSSPDETTSNGTSQDEEVAAANAAGGDNNAKVSVGTTATGNPLVVLLAAIAIVGTGFIRNRK